MLAVITNTLDTDFNHNQVVINRGRHLLINGAQIEDWQTDGNGLVVRMTTKSQYIFPWHSGAYGEVSKFNPSSTNPLERLHLSIYPTGNIHSTFHFDNSD